MRRQKTKKADAVKTKRNKTSEVVVMLGHFPKVAGAANK